MGRTFGLPSEWEDFERRNARFLSGLLPLMDACNAVWSRTLESDNPNDRVVFFLGRHIPEDFNEILLMSANGYGFAALKLLRPMFERLVTMMYLLRNPGKCTDFVNWPTIEKHKTVGYLTAEGVNPLEYLTAEELQRGEDEYQRLRAEDRFSKKQRQWTNLDLRSMAQQVGIGGLYFVLYYWPTLQVHTTAVGMSARIEATTERVSFKVGAQRDEADKALLGAHTCLLYALAEHVQHFRLSVETAPLLALHKECWNNPDTPLPEGRESH